MTYERRTIAELRAHANKVPGYGHLVAHEMVDEIEELRARCATNGIRDDAFIPSLHTAPLATEDGCSKCFKDSGWYWTYDSALLGGCAIPCADCNQDAKKPLPKEFK